MTGHAKKARDNFLAGYNCAQAVFCAFEDVTGIEHGTAMKLSSSFGGGIGKLREVCGAFTGASAVAGILWGYTDACDHAAKTEHYKLVQRIAERFKAKHGTVICRELLQGIKTSKSNAPEERTPEYYKERPCAAFVITAAEILDEIIKEKSAEIPE